MRITYDVLNNAGSSVIAVSDNTFYTGEVRGDHDKFQVFLEFFVDAACTVPVTPTAGTVTVAGSPMGNSYLAATNPVIAANTVITAGLSTYTAPYIGGKMKKGRATLAGITGAGYVKIQFWGY